jgi:hypothetical protein
LTSKPEPLERLRAWSAQRQRLCQGGQSALAALESVVAVYTTHPTAPLALLARSPGLTAAEFIELERQRQVVRIMGMRGSGFLVPTATAHIIFAATCTSLEKLGPRLGYAGLDPETFSRLVPRVLECCATPLTPSELRACLPVPEDVYMVARILARLGKILRVNASNLRTDQLKYVATTAWLGQPFEPMDRGAALAWLGRAYLRAFGPARVADFAWWTGCTRRAATEALVQSPAVEHDGMLLLDEDVDAFERVEPLDPERIDVLPKWDSYTMGYAPDGRRRFVEDRFLNLAYTSVSGSPGATAGDGLPLLLRGGRAMATWSHRLAGKALEVAVVPFEELSTTPTSEATFARVATLLGAGSLTVRTERRDRAP